MANVTTDPYIRKLVQLKKPISFIAAKVGLSEDEVAARIEKLRMIAEIPDQNGSEDLRQISGVVSSQLELLECSIGLYRRAFEDRPEVSELDAIIKSCPKGTPLAVHLLKRLIILRPFHLPAPEKLSELEKSPSSS